MASFDFKNVAVQKVDAVKMFERRRNFLKFLPAVEALVPVLLLLSWLTQPLSAVEYLRWILSGGLTGGIFIFGVVNVLIALIFSLSNHQKLTEPDLYLQYVSSSVAAPAGSYSSDAASGLCSSSAVVTESSTSEKEVKTSKSKPGTDLTSVTLTAGDAQPMRREMVRAVSSVAETAHATRRRRDMTFLRPTTTENTIINHEVYRRSRSERLDQRGEFRRSMRRLCDIDGLSNDEFRSTVETFIAGKKKMLSKDQWMKM